MTEKNDATTKNNETAVHKGATKKMPVAELTIFYDGLCHLCLTEINHYRKQNTAGKLAFVDITSTGFDAAAAGLNPKEVLRVMHLRTGSGEILTGVDAFLKIWDVMNWFSLLRKVIRLPLVNPLVHFGYHTFARARPYLPRKACDGNQCDPLRRGR